MRRRLILAAIMAAMLVVIVLQWVSVSRIKSERNRYKENTRTLLVDVNTYKVRDSLNAAKAQDLSLKLSELKKYRQEDAKLIADMEVKLRNLQAVASMVTETRTEFVTKIVRDTIFKAVNDTNKAAIIDYEDKWLTFKGRLENGQFRGNIISRDSLLIAENVRYKRFLFWRTKRIKSRDFRVVSKNPHTKIVDCEHIIVEK